MKTRTLQLLAAAPALFLAFFAFNSFTKASNTITNGGGQAGGVRFHYTAVANPSGVAGHFTWDGKTYDIVCVYKSGDGAASLYLSEGMAVHVIDGKKADQISAPFAYVVEDCEAAATSVSEIAMLPVSNGNLTVHK